MDYADKLSTLLERAIIQLAVNLCQGSSFKELVLCLEKPTYGYFCPNSIFLSDEKNYSIWIAKMIELPLHKRRSPLSFYTYVREQRDAVFEKECQRLTEELPQVLRDRVSLWMKRISLEYQSYRCRLELLFGVSRYFLMTFLSIGDWKETGRLDEKKLALRLLEDERLTVFQKYQIACVYCLHVHIPKLWNRLTEEEISLIRKDLKLLRERIRSGQLMPYENYKTHVSVLLWSYQMERNQEEKLTEMELWSQAAEQATYYGNYAALSLCWERLNEQTRQRIVVGKALLSLVEHVKKLDEDPNWRNLIKLEEIPWPNTKLPKNVFDLRSHHADLLLFFLSQMDEEQKLTFFKRVFSECNLDLRCFLDWPLQDELLRTINRLEGIITKDIFVKCVFTLAEKCSKNSTKENHSNDYRYLFRKLWETASDELKHYVFDDKEHFYHLLYLLDDEALFKRVFSALSQKDRREMMRCDQGAQIISKLLDQGRWVFLNWLLEECLPKEEIPSLKKKFIKSDHGIYWCVGNFAANRESFLQDVIDWCFEFDSEKSQFKCELMNTDVGRYLFRRNLREGKFAEAERMIDFCVSSDEMKQEIKADFALCLSL